MCNVHEFVPHLWVAFNSLSLAFRPLIRTLSVLPVCLLFLGCRCVIQLVAPMEDLVEPRRRQIPKKPLLMLGRRSLTPGRRQQTIRHAVRTTCRPRTHGIAFSPTKKSSTRVAQGIPLFHTTPKRAQTASGPCQRMLPFRRQACPTHHIHAGRRTQSRLRSTTRGYSSVTCPHHLTNL